jgi:indolepyruvate ferredoxin oxidoreductase alpha subunit
VLCPSFYRADIVQNPGRWDRWIARRRAAFREWFWRRDGVAATP